MLKKLSVLGRSFNVDVVDANGVFGNDSQILRRHKNVAGDRVLTVGHAHQGADGIVQSAGDVQIFGGKVFPESRSQPKLTAGFFHLSMRLAAFINGCVDEYRWFGHSLSSPHFRSAVLKLP